ncbi:unnamed protein product [Diatraea saccharalis]|uniref:Uncharacterized protein n=1 Tax=Diatraea saccharalis TaxID=40085 RepID=A0A9N9WGN8_9NEOP|nr:unnamed protein product [Diatraea saccharalis]
MTSCYCIFMLLNIFIVVFCTIMYNDPVHRNKRQLLFPNSTLLQFNCGIGTPTTADMIIMNWAFQANFQLPWNRSQIPVDILETDSAYLGLSRKKRDNNQAYNNDARLYHFYKYIEETLNGFGHNGTECVLLTLCHLGSEPLYVDDDEDILHELTSFALNPRNDVEFIEYEEEIRPYVEAYERGENFQNCSNHYRKCSIPLLDLFSKTYTP